MRIKDWSSDVCSSDLVHCDIGMEEQVRDVIAAAVSRFGRLDIVVNLAAASDAVIANGRRSVTEETNEGLMCQLKIDLIAPIWFFNYSIPEMKKVRWEERRVGKECGSTVKSRWS